MKTVATFPHAIFFLCLAVVAVSFVLLCLIKVPKGDYIGVVDDVESSVPQEGSLVDTMSDEERSERSEMLHVSLMNLEVTEADRDQRGSHHRP
jgi:hypothetical protein